MNEPTTTDFPALFGMKTVRGARPRKAPAGIDISAPKCFGDTTVGSFTDPWEPKSEFGESYANSVYVVVGLKQTPKGLDALFQNGCVYEMRGLGEGGGTGRISVMFGGHPDSLVVKPPHALGGQGMLEDFIARNKRLGQKHLQAKKPSTTERFVRQREYIGRVREINRDDGVFTAVLGDRTDEPERELEATFELRLLGDKQSQQLTCGSVFTLVTGYRETLDPHGHVLKSGLDTRAFLQAPRKLPERRRQAAHALADELYDDD